LLPVLPISASGNTQYGVSQATLLWAMAAALDLHKGLAALCTPAFFGSRRTSEKEPLTGMLPAHPVNGSLLWLWANSRKAG